MVPVLDKNKNPLMPCSEKRARKMMEKGEAKPYWKQGIFCIILQKEPSDDKKQTIVVGIDPGSKRTGITAATETKVILNILIDTPDQVKNKIETRRNLRRTRRNRKMPYRKCRFNRKIGGLPPSTKARWQAHLRVINVLRSIMPVSDIVIEDIKAVTKKGSRRWNKSFSPLEIGKKWFESQLDLPLHKFQGFDTKNQRDYRGFKKTNKKLADVWEAHNVDSHCLCELYVGDLNPFKGILKCNLLNYYRRQLHVQNPIKGGIRKQYGGTMSLGLKRGTLVTHTKYGKCYIGGTSKGRITLHNIETAARVTRSAKIEDIKILSRLKWRSFYISSKI
jgi:hypothetical protein